MSSGFAKRVNGGLDTRNRFDDETLRTKALATLPVQALLQRSHELLGEQVSSTLQALDSPNQVVPLRADCPGEFRDAFAKALLEWFKRDFFKWMNAPRCDSCEGSETKIVQTAPPLDEERRHLASVVEVYECVNCGAWQRFPRYNCPSKLLETRTGRCGEWANCFGLIACAAGFEVRYVVD